MNLYVELEKATAPAPCCSAIKTLSREEIEQLQAAGVITPIEEIPAFHNLPRVSHPPAVGKTTYGKSLPNRCSQGAR